MAQPMRTRRTVRWRRCAPRSPRTPTLMAYTWTPRCGSSKPWPRLKWS
jgi:hypothetical protein